MFSRIWSFPNKIFASSKRTKLTKQKRTLESTVRDRLAKQLVGSRIEVPCSSGLIDIVTPTEIIEVKRAPLWKAAMGQILAYGEDFPKHKKRVHLFGKDDQHYRLAAVTCERFGVALTMSEPDTDKIKDVLLGTDYKEPGKDEITEP
ncbi:hypothetical protein TetV_066 [Tetraselmis virus 1]|uniref:Uncharacterized protein n=1 Tax=Tetraselmis virus 1 TaxID=2060617 RepID=A0A2P0VMM5_9VIRU|nr:hypothetical protein QJ968_gp066 [Tetraselmis virus 1]AUF82158.1 hypothetical protein TetV_066 [Tetraselmis virus 1]